MCFPSSAAVFGGIVMAGAFAVQYTGIMVLQVTNCELLNRPYKVESLWEQGLCSMLYESPLSTVIL